jgi:hypothetical protein
MQTVVVHKIDHALYELSATTMVFWPIVQIDDEGGDVAKALTHRLPPLGDAVSQTVAGDFGHDTVEKDFIDTWQQPTDWCQSGLRLDIVICRLGWDSSFATSRKGTDFDGGFGIDGDPEDMVSRIGLAIDLTQLVEDRLG